MKNIIRGIIFLGILCMMMCNCTFVYGRSVSEYKDPQLISACYDFSGSRKNFKHAKKLSGYESYLHKQHLIRKRKIAHQRKIMLQASLYKDRLINEYFQDNDVKELIKMNYPTNFIEY